MKSMTIENNRGIDFKKESFGKISQIVQLKCEILRRKRSKRRTIDYTWSMAKLRITNYVSKRIVRKIEEYPLAAAADIPR
ncbi:hypothetical protein [Enterococcus sp. AZ126]|uniref:hypothetical protein n=1 Tax=Enterococcus sp. AZ126 TaxID=2774635 RepID=UPI003F6846A7